MCDRKQLYIRETYVAKMPALVNTDKVIATEMAESTFKQCITVVEKKVRNLEKRKVSFKIIVSGLSYVRCFVCL